MIRKKGSLIIENMLSSAMIIILILGICQVIVSKDKWHEIKNKEDEFTRITYAVEEELKYNLSIEEIKNLANSNVISLSKDNILKCLTTEGLEMIQKGDDIEIPNEIITSNKVKPSCLFVILIHQPILYKTSFTFYSISITDFS